MTKEILLNNGWVAKVDDEDYKIISQLKWHVVKWGKCFYALHTGPRDEYGKQHPISMHRMIMEAKIGEQIDHKNRDGLDNRKCNLRKCSTKENIRNCGLSSRNKTGYKGVRYSKERDYYTCRLDAKEHKIYLGIFENKEEAALVHDEAAEIYYGEFAYLNFPEIPSSERNIPYEVKCRINKIVRPSMRRNNSSGYRGVKWHKRSKLWYVCININKKRIYIGSYKSKILGALNYDDHAKRLLGNKAKLNFPSYT